MKKIVLYGEGMPCFDMPADKELFKTLFWTASEAARHWGCHPNTAREYIKAHPGLCGVTRVALKRRGGLRVVKVIPARRRRHRMSLAGNPNFTNSDYQRRLALRRWRRGYR